jgi:hypothetical protein
MSGWESGANPFPKEKIERISDIHYIGELKFICHATVHLDKTPRSLWQLSTDFGVTMTVHPKEGAAYSHTVTAPRGLYTDLASVPPPFWSFIGPIGKHLEISILHDYLYMAWTDYHDTASRQDWRFADKMFAAGLKASGVNCLKRNVMYHIVHSCIGWGVFREKSYTLEERMNGWLPHFEADHGRDG